MLKLEQLYNGVWTKRTDHYHMVIAKWDEDLAPHAQYVFRLHGMLDDDSIETAKEWRSDFLPDGFYIGLPQFGWLGGLIKNEVQLFLSFTGTEWKFGSAQMLSLRSDCVERVPDHYMDGVWKRMRSENFLKKLGFYRFSVPDN